MLGATNTALLVIDMQRDFLDTGGYATSVGSNIPRLRRAISPVACLLRAARSAGMLIVHTREGHMPDLSDCPPAKLDRAQVLGAAIGSRGPMGRLLIRGEYGHDFVNELEPEPGEIVIDKPGYSAFERTDLEPVLASRGITQLILCGITTEVCVSSTLRAAVDRGYRCVTVSDACASAYPDLHDASLRTIEVEGGVFGAVLDTAQVVVRLRAGREAY
jgi:nicotinamidase-related amidase